MIELQYKKLDPRAIPPRQAYEGDAGWDLFVLEDTWVAVEVPTDVRTGVAVAVPEGHFGRITHRSSAPRKRGVMVLDGTIDAGFRGELFACAYVWAFVGGPQADYIQGKTIRAGESIAQLIIHPVPQATLVEKVELSPSERGTKGFGSSGH